MNKTSRLLIATCAVFSMVSCVKEDNFLSSSRKMSFKAGAGQMITTKTQYSDVVDNIARIDWQVGDVLSIYCPEAENNQQGDFTVSKVSSTTGHYSEAVIAGEEDEEKALWWGEDGVEHHIYAVYPSPAASLYESDVFEEGRVSGYIFESQKPLSLDKVGTGVYEAKPNLLSQYMVAKTSMKPDAKGSSVFLNFYPLTTAIEFEIQNDYFTEEDMKVAAVQLLSPCHVLNGAFNVDLTGWDTSAGLPSTSSEGLTIGTNMVEIDFTGEENGYLPVAHGEKLRFTLFMLPNEDIDDLIFRVVDPEGGYVSTKLAYSNDPTYGNNGITFKRSTKSFVKGVLVPEGARWTITLTGDMSSWTNQEAGTLKFSNPQLQTINLVSSWLSGEDEYVQMDGDYTYSLTVVPNPELLNTTDHGAVIANGINVDSKKSNDILGEKAANWRLQIYDKTNKKWVDASTDRTKNPKGVQWVSFDRIAGSADAHIKVTVHKGDPLSSDEVAYEYSSIAEHDKILRDTPAKGTKDQPWDLSAHDIYGNANTNGAETANCYVINAPGWYAFPLVYGNAITNGRDYKTSYFPDYHTTGQRYIREFQNTHGSSEALVTSNLSDGRITSPYIETDIARYEKNDYRAYCHVGASNTYQKCPVTNEWTAFPIWQDTPNAIVTDDVSNCFVISKEQAADKGLALGNKCGYIVFCVNKDNLTQGNVLIGLNHNYRRYHTYEFFGTHEQTDAEWDRLMWSWHIWVTDEPLNTVNVDNGQGMKSAMMPVNLGWVDGGQTIHTSYKDLEAKVRIAQERSDGEEYYSDEIIVKRAGHPLSTISPEGSSPYYQQGRPTPMPRLKDLTLKNYRDVDNSGYLLHNGYSVNITNITNLAIATSIGNVLSNPTTFYGSPVSEQGLVLSTEVYGQWFCETYASVLHVALSIGYAPSNLWNAACWSEGTRALPTVKTVYDPCPPGFCVPNGDSFNGIQRAGDGSTFSTHKGINFYTNSEQYETIFMPAMGGINRGGILKDMAEGISQGDLVVAGNMNYVGTKGYYWLSTGGPSSLPGSTLISGNDSHSLRIEDGSINGNTEENSRANGFCVRPQKIVEWDKF